MLLLLSFFNPLSHVCSHLLTERCTSKVLHTYLFLDSWHWGEPVSIIKSNFRYSVRVSPQMANRIVDSARSILNKFIPDIYIYTDHMKGVSSGKSPGFGLSLVAETTNGTFLSAELASNPQGQGAAVLPEDLGRNCAKLLLEEIYRDRVFAAFEEFFPDYV
ncbi:RNA 3'-terminal phosphate cyclase-like protein isoform X10 [Leptonychotes weddellii]|uniref:RNA 3'-terminal phosphate cyclase-like protein isoform X10 n=1 Tax=Leptonychotes weddellii TaxID=9713 RepID=A0A7F8PYG8_LEPWE|nr:RNA 3'-terminal phosphate cyclase-like protein isoform X10 [Leptonychotes weddellii]